MCFLDEDDKYAQALGFVVGLFTDFFDFDLFQHTYLVLTKYSISVPSRVFKLIVLNDFKYLGKIVKVY